MEKHRQILKIDKNNIPSMDLNYLEYFKRALQFTKDNYSKDLERIQNTKLNDITPEYFMIEICWVILASGFRASVISGFFDQFIRDLEPLILFAAYKRNDDGLEIIKSIVLKHINNVRKIDAIFEIANILNQNIKTYGWEWFKNNQLNNVDKLETLPFIGPITKYHLARNIGNLDVVKPDKHLVRMANKWGFNNARELCIAIKEKYNIELGIIDLVFWYSASQFGTLEKK